MFPVEAWVWNTIPVYINRLSVFLVREVQFKKLKSIAGSESAQLLCPSYVTECYHVRPSQLDHWFETQLTGNLYVAGEINGMTGYEVSACQGLMTGTVHKEGLMTWIQER
jgi:tRNA uridine 5-carboxymethylaminomethyl modification enzyme